MDARGRLTPALVLLALLIPVVGGCGGDAEVSREEYEQRLADASNDLDAAVERLSSQLDQAASGSSSLDEAAEQIGEIRSELESTASELGDVEPPEEAREPNDQLVDSLDAFAADLEEFQEAVEEGNVQRVQEFVRGLNDLESLQNAQEAAQELAEQGFEFGGATTP